jgi:hypothetical protein
MAQEAELTLSIAYVTIFLIFVGLVLCLYFFKTKSDDKSWANLAATMEQKNMEYIKIRRRQTLRSSIACIVGTSVLDIFATFAFWLDLKEAHASLIIVCLLIVVKVTISAVILGVFCREIKATYLSFVRLSTLGVLLVIGSALQMVITVVVSVLYGRG